MKFGLIIPTLNADVWLDQLLPRLKSQTRVPTRILVIDSQSDDFGAKRFSDFGAEVITIARKDFDHGGTRQLGFHELKDLPFQILMTQDALPADDYAFENLIAAFSDSEVGLAYGRQLPRRGAKSIEAHARLFNYPDRTFSDDARTLESRGIRASFCSNSFCAYRTTALAEVGGFPSNCIFGEDAVVAVRMMKAGWSKAYVSDAMVYHSHAYTTAQEFRRSFDIGVLHSTAPEMLSASSKVGGEGAKFVLSELRYLLSKDPLAIPGAILRTGAKYSGYKLGTRHASLSVSNRIRFGMNKSFWRQDKKI